MKKLFGIMTVLAFFMPLVALTQDLRYNLGGPKQQQSHPFGFMVGGDGTYISRQNLPTVAEGNAQLGVFFGRGKTSFLVLAGINGHSDITKTPVSRFVYDPYCGCREQVSIFRDPENYLRIFHFQVGAAFQSKGKVMYLAGGIADFNRRELTIVDSITVDMVSLPRKKALAVSFSGKFRIGQNLLILDAQAFPVEISSSQDSEQIVQDSENADDQIVARGSITYLWDTNKKYHEFKTYGGIQASYLFHVVSGHEFLFGPKFLLGLTEKKFPFDANLSLGGSYNPDDGEGLGFYLSFGMGLNRQNKFVYR